MLANTKVIKLYTKYILCFTVRTTSYKYLHVTHWLNIEAMPVTTLQIRFKW